MWWLSGGERLWTRVLWVLSDEKKWYVLRMRKKRRLADTYRFPGFRPEHHVRGCFGDPKTRILRLVRRGKKRSAAPAVFSIGPFTTARLGGYAICPVGIRAFTWKRRSGGCPAKAAVR